MKGLPELSKELDDLAIIMQLTGAFEGLASMRISQIRNQVLGAQQFFNELWNIYTQIRVDTLFRFGRVNENSAIDKQLCIIITSAGGFSGDIDQRLIDLMMTHYDAAKQDIIVVGYHGAILLRQKNITFKKYYKMPVKDVNINVEPLVREIRQYKSALVFYQTYKSLTEQAVSQIDISSAIRGLGAQATASKDVISEANYIFEPSTFEVVAYLEQSMLQVALGQVIFDSKLAQYASRFQAMSLAKNRAEDSLKYTKLLFSRAKRALRDEETKQIIASLRKVHAR